MVTASVNGSKETQATNIEPKIVNLERRRGLSYETFLHEHAIPRRPVILEDATKDWPALKRWTPKFFRDHYGNKPVEIGGKHYTLGEVIDLALASNDEKPAPYYRNITLHEEFPELIADTAPMPAYCKPNWFHSPMFAPVRAMKLMMGGGNYEFFLGGAGRSFPYLHFDVPGAHSFLSQVYGRKLLVLFSPDDTQYLYPKPGNKFFVSSISDIDNPDLGAFPLFANATRIHAEVHEGDTLFMPYGWWHTARMLSFSITLGIDVSNATNWNNVVKFMSLIAYDRKPVLGRPYMTYVRMVGAMKRLGEAVSRR